MNNLDLIYNSPSPYYFNKEEKARVLQDALAFLDDFHRERCEPYARIRKSFSGSRVFSNCIYLPVRLFKEFDLKSIDDSDLFKTLTSSGTTSQRVSKIYLDKQTAANQSKVLVKIMQHFLGKRRLPMLILDHPSVVKDRNNFSARGAGILGLSTFGRDHTYALNDDMTLNVDVVSHFAERYKGVPVFLFGFTFMVWEYFLQGLQKSNLKLDFSAGVLVHSGGWKKLIDKAVSNEAFKSKLKQECGIRRVHNFYGMVEQVGSIFVECEHGFLHAPDFADIEVLDPQSLEPVPFGTHGVIAVSSVIPMSYPGHRLLTEDRGVIYGDDTCSCGLPGKYFSVLGRLPMAEVRGCSDTHTEGQA